MSTENPNTVMSEQGVLLRDRVIGGVTLKAGSTPQERFQALARSMEAGTFAPSHNGAGPPLDYRTASTEQRFAQGESQAAPRTIGGKAPPPSAATAAPPSPQELEASRTAKIADFDAQMRAEGKQLPARDDSGKFAPKPTVSDPDYRLVDALNKAFAALPPAERDAKRALYEHELAEAYQGRRLGETRGQFSARTAPGTATSLTPEQRSYNAALQRAVDAQDANGALDASAIGPELTHGYSIPPGSYADLKDLLDGLKIARKQNFSQEKVTRIIRETMSWAV